LKKSTNNAKHAALTISQLASTVEIKRPKLKRLYPSIGRETPVLLYACIGKEYLGTV